MKDKTKDILFKRMYIATTLLNTINVTGNDTFCDLIERYLSCRSSIKRYEFNDEYATWKYKTDKEVKKYIMESEENNDGSEKDTNKMSVL